MIAFFLSSSCSNSVSKIDLGNGFVYGKVHEDVHSIYWDGRRFMRGNIKIISNDKDYFFGYINADIDDFKDDRGAYDRTGYFVVDKVRAKIAFLGDFVNIVF